MRPEPKLSSRCLLLFAAILFLAPLAIGCVVEDHHDEMHDDAMHDHAEEGHHDEDARHDEVDPHHDEEALVDDEDGHLHDENGHHHGEAEVELEPAYPDDVELDADTEEEPPPGPS